MELLFLPLIFREDGDRNAALSPNRRGGIESAGIKIPHETGIVALKFLIEPAHQTGAVALKFLTLSVAHSPTPL